MGVSELCPELCPLYPARARSTGARIADRFEREARSIADALSRSLGFAPKSDADNVTQRSH